MTNVDKLALTAKLSELYEIRKQITERIKQIEKELQDEH